MIIKRRRDGRFWRYVPRLGAVTTAANQTVVIQEWNATAPTTINWGDGSTKVVPANTGTTISHTYAVAGTYTIRLSVSPLAVTRMDFRDVGLQVYSAWLKQCVNTIYFRCSTGPQGVINSADMSAWRPITWDCFILPAGFTGVINSADMSAWRPTTWLCFSLPAGFTGTINSADMSAWRPTYWYCFNLPTGFTGTINSADMSAWRPTDWQCCSLPAVMRPLTVAAADFSAWTTMTNFYIKDNSLSQAQVDAVLQGMYAAFATRTVANGTILAAGNNAAPSGTYQADCPPVSGKEWAYELTHDSCSVNPTHKWLTVTTN